MHGYNFTERTRKVLAMAREEASRLQHEYVGTEHLLLGLVREGEGVAAAVLQSLGVDLEEIQHDIEKTVTRGKPRDASQRPDLPYTSKAKKVLEFAMAEALELKHSYIGTEHILLGLLREDKGIAAQVLGDVGLDIHAARAETLRLLGAEPPNGQAVSRGARARAVPKDASQRFEIGYERQSLDRLLSRCSKRFQDIVHHAFLEARTALRSELHAEHLLLTLLRQEDGLASLIIRRLGIDREALRAVVTDAAERLPRSDAPDEGLAPSAVVALRTAADEGDRSRAVLGTDHLLLGLLLIDQGSTPRLLGEAGLSAGAVRAERAKILE
jgi:ATP-dependent Clp protease ATP-binding subunit ClpA